MRARSQVSVWLRHAFLLTLVWGVLRAGAEAQAPKTHFVDVGLNGFAQFTDRDTGKTTLSTNPVPTVIRVGDTVQWVFNYEHSATNGTCPGGFCSPAVPSIFDSGIRFGTFPQNFQKTFTSSGIVPYFCQVHLAAMQGKIIVLSGPEFFLDVAPNNQVFPVPPVPTVTVMANQAGVFTGNISGFDYRDPVTLSCQNGVPRVPNFCPGATVVPDGAGNAVPFNLTVSDSTPGTYLFDLMATGPDPNDTTKRVTKSQRVQLNAADLVMTPPLPGTVTTIAGTGVQPETNFQLEAIADFGGFVTLVCNGLPAGSFCTFSPNFQLVINPLFPQTMNIGFRVFVSTFTAPSDIYPVQIQASTVFAGNNVSRSQPLTVRVVPADHLEFTGPATATINTPVNLPFRAIDGNGFPLDAYGQTVHLTSTDPNAILPADYTFVTQGLQTDHGVHTFSVTLKTLGPRIVTATDLSPFAFTASTPVILVQPSTASNNTLGMLSDRGPGNEPFFRNEAVNLEITVTGASTPSGKVHLFDGITEITPAAGLTLSAVDATTAHAMVPTMRMRPGGHALTVVYDGAGAFLANLSTFSQPRSPAPRCVAGRCPGSH